MSTLQMRRNFIYIVFGLYVLYALLNIGMTGLLFSGAVGLIAMSFEIDLELSIALIILSGIAWKLFSRRSEGFQNPQAIVKRIQTVQNKKAFEPQGVMSSFVEGFSNAEEKKETPTETPTASSSPAPTDAPTATPQLEQSLPAPQAKAPVATETKPPAQTQGFADKLTDGMFQLGSIPPDAVGGSHIDVGTTMMNALNALKPDQIKLMTDDTRKLLETQKSLMGMLQSMKPMLQDGKELMGTFNEMFGTKPQ